MRKMVAVKTKNVKIPLELLDLIEKRNGSGKPPGEVMLDIMKEYLYLETVARRLTNAGETDKINIPEAIDKVFADTKNDLERMKKEHDEFKTMLQGLQLFFTKVKG